MRQHRHLAVVLAADVTGTIAIPTRRSSKRVPYVCSGAKVE
jgi:hypothetical protein